MKVSKLLEITGRHNELMAERFVALVQQRKQRKPAPKKPARTEPITDLDSPLAQDAARLAIAMHKQTGLPKTYCQNVLFGYADARPKPRYRRGHFSEALYKRVNEWLDAHDEIPVNQGATKSKNAETLAIIARAPLRDWLGYNEVLADPMHGGYRSVVALARLIEKVLS